MPMARRHLHLAVYMEVVVMHLPEVALRLVKV
jgi:hypothetical protein